MKPVKLPREEPRYFRHKKYAIAVITTLRMVVIITVVVLICTFVGRFIDEYAREDEKPDTNESIHLGATLIISAVVIGGIFALIFSIIGLVGVVKENQGLCIAYCILEALTLIGASVQATKVSAGLWISPIFSLVIITLTALYIRDLSHKERIRSERERNQSLASVDSC